MIIKKTYVLSHKPPLPHSCVCIYITAQNKYRNKNNHWNCCLIWSQTINGEKKAISNCHWLIPETEDFRALCRSRQHTATESTVRDWRQVPATATLIYDEMRVMKMLHAGVMACSVLLFVVWRVCGCGWRKTEGKTTHISNNNMKNDLWYFDNENMYVHRIQWIEGVVWG